MIDPICHLGLIPDAQKAWHHAQAAGVKAAIIPGTVAEGAAAQQALAHQLPGVFYAAGIHPLCWHTPSSEYSEALAQEKSLQTAYHEALTTLSHFLNSYRDDPQLVALGEMGLDFFPPEWQNPALKAAQIALFEAQLQLAQLFELPVILHVRKAHQAVLQSLKKHPVSGGICHAFNGSLEQAKAYRKLGFKLSFGGAATYPKARKLRMLAATLPLSDIVIETDCPDMPPSWLEGGYRQNRPDQLPKIAAELAALRGITLQELIKATQENTLQVLPRLKIE